MPLSQTLRLIAAAGVGAAGLSAVSFPAPVQARVAEPGATCLTPRTNEAAAAARGGATGVDHRGISPAEQRAIAARTKRNLAADRASSLAGSAAVVTRTVPVHVHVMRSGAGRGDVTNWQINQQITILNKDFASIGYSFNLISTSRHNNSAWHKDHQSARYRALTRRGGANALNIWLVSGRWLGIATFPWDYARKGAVDGIRVNYTSVPGGSSTNYNEGRTATHETGHWLGLFHTFQGGCTQLNDQVQDTPAQATPTSGCPTSRDSCPLPGNDPFHNYMDYSWDSCYYDFTQGQAARIARMWTAYR
jgi:Pregnancy-associated plasma protein-A